MSADMTTKPRKKRVKPVDLNHGRFCVSKRVFSADRPYGQEQGFEVALMIERWFWYREGYRAMCVPPRTSADAISLMKSIYRGICKKQVGDDAWPNVLELVYWPRINEFVEMHKAELSSLNLAP